MNKITEEIKHRFEDEPQQMIYKARVTHFYYHDSNLIYIVKLLDQSLTHKELVKGSLQVICFKDEDDSQFVGHMGSYSRDDNSPFVEDTFLITYQSLVGHDFTFYFKKNKGEHQWVFEKVEKLENYFSTSELNAYRGKIASVAYTNFELEVLFEIATDRSSYSKEKRSHFRSYIYHVNDNEEDFEIFLNTFAPFIEYDGHSDKVIFFQQQLIVVEPPNKIITVGDVTSIDTSLIKPIKVFPFRKEVESV